MLPGDLTRTRKLAGDAGLDALLAFTPRDVGHLAGFAPANQTVTGVYWALLPTDPALPTALTVGEFDLVWARARAQADEIRATQLWIEIDDLADLEAGTVQAVPSRSSSTRRRSCRWCARRWMPAGCFAGESAGPHRTLTGRHAAPRPAGDRAGRRLAGVHRSHDAQNRGGNRRATPRGGPDRGGHPRCAHRRRPAR